MGMNEILAHLRKEYTKRYVRFNEKLEPEEYDKRVLRAEGFAEAIECLSAMKRPHPTDCFNKAPKVPMTKEQESYFKNITSVLDEKRQGSSNGYMVDWDALKRVSDHHGVATKDVASLIEPILRLYGSGEILPLPADNKETENQDHHE